MSDLIPFSDVKEMTRLMSKSVMIPKSLQDKPYDIFVILQMGIELGLKPMQALNGINVIQGKPTLAPQTMLALIYQKSAKPYIRFFTKLNEAGEFESYCCEMAREKGQDSYTAEWNEKKAREMNLLTKDNWKKQFENMCKWRCVSEAARVIFPDIIQGFYTPEEMEENIELEKQAPRIEPEATSQPISSETTIKEIEKTFNANSINIELPDTSTFIDKHTTIKVPVSEKEMKHARTSFINKVTSLCDGNEAKKNDIYKRIGLDKNRQDYTETDFKAFENAVIELFADTSKQESLL